MSPEQIPDQWLAALQRAEELDPVVREALRPVFDRLKSDAPQQASSFALAMICRALRMIEPPPGTTISREEMRRDLAALCAAYVSVNPDHPHLGYADEEFHAP